jgi:type IV secretory pathway TraG/TraD family ATPase VirD4
MSQRLATAEWADPEIYAKEHAYKEGKFWLGRSPLNGQPLGYVDDRHICLVSGTRAGKGTTSIINNLCLWPGSVVVVDPKGENATVTASRRGKGSEHCEGMGQAVHVLDPFNAAQVDDSLRSRFNPLDALDPNDPITIDEAGRVADAIVVMNPESKDPFWDQSARTLVKGLILHVLTAPQFEGRRNLVTIRRLIARGDHEGIATLKEMGETDLPSAQALLWEGVAQNNAFNGVVAGIGDSMVNMAVNASKQFESVLQVANRNTEFLDSAGMQACLETSDFKMSDLKTDPNGVSMYLSLPQRYMGEHFRWLRMMITLAMTEMEATKGQPATGHRVLMCLDEFAGLKRMEVIENAVAQIAGYGVKLFFVLQSLEQLKATYKDNWETFLSNAGLKIFFGIDDHFTREYVSKFIGETELLRELRTSTNTVNQQTTQSTGSSSSSSWNQQESTGVSFSDNWKAMPFFLRNTAGLLAAVTGKRQASRSDNTNTAKSDGGSDGTQNTEATASGTATADGKNESLHKRPLITPDEIGQHFNRIDDIATQCYPGLGLVLMTGAAPGVVQRSTYFEDPHFARKFGSHPDHGLLDAAERQRAIRAAQHCDPIYDESIPCPPESESYLDSIRSSFSQPTTHREAVCVVDLPIERVWSCVLETQNYNDWTKGLYSALPSRFGYGTRVKRNWHMDGGTRYAVVGHCNPPYQFYFYMPYSRNITESLFVFELSEISSNRTEIRFCRDTFVHQNFSDRVENLFKKIFGIKPEDTETGLVNRTLKRFVEYCENRW